MSTDPAPVLELEDEIKPYRQRIERIDRIIEGPARTLIRQARQAVETLKSGDPPRFPLWIADDPVPNSWPNALTTSLCLVTLHRLNRMRRRFPQLKNDTRGLHETLETLRLGYLPVRSKPDDPDARREAEDAYFGRCAHFVDSRTFGFLNPFTSAQVFRLLMESGEDHAHTGVGCLSFFAMVWPLYRRSPNDPLDIGARIEPYRPTAYVTAKCLLPLIELRTICDKRAKLFKTINGHLAKLGTYRDEAAQSSLSHWRFCAELDSLRNHLLEMAEISISRDAFVVCEAQMEELLRGLGPKSALGELYKAVVRAVGHALQKVAVRSAALLDDAGFILGKLQSDVIAPLCRGAIPQTVRREKHGKLRFGIAPTEPDHHEFDLSVFRFDFPESDQPSKYEEYLKALGTAGTEAAELCGNILEELRKASGLQVEVLPDDPDAATLQRVVQGIQDALTDMAQVNSGVSTYLARPVDLHTRWCHTVVNRHVAFAAAQNFTDFDASELVSALSVVVRKKDLLTEAEVTNALQKAVVGREPDGSWRVGHPYFSADGLQALRAPAADVVWTLVAALARFPAIRVADEALFSFVEWLERTRREVWTASPEAAEPVDDFGWSADQMREQERVELFTTSYAVNALLAVRDLAEHRLWELCERRFTIVYNSKPLEEMAPVDLMMPHSRRLHSRLASMIHDNRTNQPDAVYSMVLHGPPGSSKTTVAGALSHAMGGRSDRWGRNRRLVRVTPADFTRLGEDRVDAQAHAIFELLRHVRGATILFDEIDDLLRRREFSEDTPRFLDLVIPAMLNRLQDLRDACVQQEICFLFGTNYVERIEPALMRRGRIDSIIPVPYPDQESRQAIAEEVLDPGEVLPRRIDGDDAWKAAWKDALVRASAEVAAHTGGWSWSGVREIAKKVRGEIAGKLASSGDAAVLPDDVVKSWDKVVARQVADNPPDIRTDTIYPERLAHGSDSRELRLETLRHLLTYCRKAEGHQLLEELQGRINQLPSTDSIRVLHGEAARFLSTLGLFSLDGGRSAQENGTS